MSANDLTHAHAPLDLIWEVAEIARLIGRTQRQTFHMLNKGELPGKKIGGRWVIERSKLVSTFIGDAA